LDKKKKTHDSRLKNSAAAKYVDPLKAKKTASKKPKVAPVVAMDKNTRKMQKMMKTMDLAGNAKAEGDSSDFEDIEEEAPMEVDTVMTKTIKKQKPLPRTYYQSLKKTLRR
jgi:hypothetical protein